MTKNPTKRPPFRESADLVPVRLPHVRGNEYTFMTRQRASRTTARHFTDARPTMDDVRLPMPVITETVPSPEDEIASRIATADIPAPAFSITIDVPKPVESPKPVHHDPNLCACVKMRGALNVCIDITLDAQFVIPRLALNEGAMIANTLQWNALAAQESWERLAYRHCPFDGRLIDHTLASRPHTASIGQPPLCCDWMAMMVESERIRLPAPEATVFYAYLVSEGASPVAFFFCGRCGIEMCELVQRRREFFRTR